MDSNQILTITVFVIVITVVGTIALAVVGYLAFRLRERKHPTRPGLDQNLTRPYFFERVRLAPQAQTDADAPAALDPVHASMVPETPSRPALVRTASD